MTSTADDPRPLSASTRADAERVARILLVEDDLGLARATKRLILERDGCEVELAHDLHAADEALRGGTFDVVMSDFELPDGTGAEVLARARRHQPDAPRILATSHTEWSAAARSVNEGEVFRILPKPIAPETLHRTLDEAVELKRRRDAERSKAMEVARGQRALEEKNARLSVRASYLDRLVDARTRDLLQVLLEGLELRREGAKRSARCVAAVARRVGELAELEGSDLDDVELAGLLHDVGTLVAASDAHDDPLQAFDERAPSLGRLAHDMLRPAAFLRGVAWLLRDHEARWDGKSEGVAAAGDEIPIGARALAIAVRYVELVGDGARLDAGVHDAACAVLQREAGARLDPELVGRVMAHPVEAWVAVVRSSSSEAAP